jgi:glycosyltransferase involved in cell wall biosynthesis
MEETTGAFDVVRAHVDVPVVVRLHGPYFLNAAALDMPKDAYYRNRVAKERAAISRARGVTSPSLDTLNRVRREYGLELAQAEVIPNPAPAVSKDQLWRPQDADPNLILFVGRFDKHKGGDLVIQAFAKIAATRPAVRLAFIGPDWRLFSGSSESISYPEFLADQVPDAAIRNRIEYLGPKAASEIRPWRLRAGVTIVASRYENFPMTVVEAIAHGCPLVAARVGGIPEIVTNEKNGLLFEAGDTDDLARSVGKMLDHPDRAAEWASQAVRDAQSRFASHVIARQTADYYQRFLATTR